MKQPTTFMTCKDCLYFKFTRYETPNVALAMEFAECFALPQRVQVSTNRPQCSLFDRRNKDYV